MKMVMFSHQPGSEQSAMSLSRRMEEEQDRLIKLIRLAENPYEDIIDEDDLDELDGQMRYIE